jgi:hypothetical protein
LTFIFLDRCNGAEAQWFKDKIWDSTDIEPTNIGEGDESATDKQSIHYFLLPGDQVLERFTIRAFARL